MSPLRIHNALLARQSTGYVFLIYEDEQAVERLVQQCYKEDDRYYLLVSSPTMREKPVRCIV